MAAYKMLAVLGAFALVTPLLYTITKQKYRYLTLLFTSLLLFFFVSRAGIIFLIANITALYVAGSKMNKISNSYDLSSLEKAQRKAIKAEIKKKKKKVLFLYICFVLGIMFILKYYKMFSGHALIPFSAWFLMPLGLSYYSLQSIGYLIDVYRGKYSPEKNILKLSLFVCFLPQLHEGPFGRYDQLIEPMTNGAPLKRENIFNGISEILWGLFKIFMIANRAAILADSIFKDYGKYNGYIIFTGGIFFVIQLYTEFSGYINIAKGISEFFGISLADNFNFPFLAEDIADFWRRWHISLGTWFRDYVFYPVSTSKWLNRITGKMPSSSGDFTNLTISLFIVWFLTGLWHGASYKYVIYGLYYFALMTIHNLLKPHTDKLLLKFNISNELVFLKVIRIIKTQFLVIIGMILFRSENLNTFYNTVLSMFSGGESIDLTRIIDHKDLYVLFVSLLILISVYFVKTIKTKLPGRFSDLHLALQYLLCLTAVYVIIIFGAYGLDYLPPDPVYGGF